jgi:hypothetical protein
MKAAAEAEKAAEKAQEQANARRDGAHDFSGAQRQSSQSDGSPFFRNVNERALAALDLWVPALFGPRPRTSPARAAIASRPLPSAGTWRRTSRSRRKGSWTSASMTWAIRGTESGRPSISYRARASGRRQSAAFLAL